MSQVIADRVGPVRISADAVKIMREALACYGRQAQLGMLQEECAECIAAINRVARGREFSEQHLVDELVDVLIMTVQVMMTVDAIDVERVFESKIRRLEGRLKRDGWLSVTSASGGDVANHE